MEISLQLKPLSINAAYRGQRYDTAAKKLYDKKLAWFLPRGAEPGPYYHIHYRFYLVNFAATDQQNLLKCLTDGLVRRGLIRDDRYIVKEVVEKFPSAADRIEVHIKSVPKPKRGAACASTI